MGGGKQQTNRHTLRVRPAGCLGNSVHSRRQDGADMGTERGYAPFWRFPGSPSKSNFGLRSALAWNSMRAALLGFLDATTWKQPRQQLQKLGGPPKLKSLRGIVGARREYTQFPKTESIFSL